MHAEAAPEAREGVALDALLRSAFDALTDALLLVGADGEIAAWNEAFARLWDLPREADEDAAAAITQRMAAQLEEGRAVVDAVFGARAAVTSRAVRLRDGRALQLSARALPSGRLWCFRDVSDQEEMRVTAARYRALYDETPVMMHSIDRAGRLVSVSNAWLDALGYRREEVLGVPSVDFLTEESRSHAVEVVLPEYFRTGTCHDVPYRVRKKNGETMDVLLSAIAERDHDGAHRRSLAVLVDVTERLRLEAERDRLLIEERRALASAESALALLDTLFRTAPIGLAFLDRDLRYVRANDAIAQSFHGVTPEVSVGRTVWEALPALAPTIAPLLLRVIATGQPVTNVELTGELPSAAGESSSVLASYYPVRAGDGEVLGVGVTAIDITEQKRVATLQAQLFREAREAVRVRDEFLATASHELRTPLTPLLIHLEVLLDRARRGRAIDPRMLEKALQQVAKLTALVGDLLDSSRVEAGRLELHEERVPLAAVVLETVTAERVARPTHSIELEVHGDPIVLGDRARLAQVLSNLIENAVKYSERGTTVRVSLGCHDGEALLSVADRGIGIPSDELPKLFRRFFRARNAPTTHYGGLGLGLDICRDIVERHRGRIWAESELGAGSTFHVALPLRR